MENMNKTTLRLEIGKTIQPKQFEPIKIIVDVQESFYWKDDEERIKKMQAHTDRIAKDFVKTFNEVVKTIGEEDRCLGRVITSGDISNVSSDSKDEEWDFS